MPEIRNVDMLRKFLKGQIIEEVNGLSNASSTCIFSFEGLLHIEFEGVFHIGKLLYDIFDEVTITCSFRRQDKKLCSSISTRLEHLHKTGDSPLNSYDIKTEKLSP